MLMKYKDILGKVKNQITAILGKGYSFTPAIIKEKDGHKCEVYFVYHISENGGISRPYIRLVTDCDTGVILEYKNAYYHEFADANKFPLGSVMNADVPAAQKACEQLELLDKQRALYEYVREFAYSENISDEEQKILREYRKCLFDMVPIELMDFCLYTENAFFFWMDKKLGK